MQVPNPLGTGDCPAQTVSFHFFPGFSSYVRFACWRFGLPLFRSPVRALLAVDLDLLPVGHLDGIVVAALGVLVYA